MQRGLSRFDMSLVAANLCGYISVLMLMCLWWGVQEPEELFETVTQCLMSGADRDALSGWGAIVYVMCEHLSHACSASVHDP